MVLPTGESSGEKKKSSLFEAKYKDYSVENYRRLLSFHGLRDDRIVSTLFDSTFHGRYVSGRTSNVAKENRFNGFEGGSSHMGTYLELDEDFTEIPDAFEYREPGRTSNDVNENMFSGFERSSPHMEMDPELEIKSTDADDTLDADTFKAPAAFEMLHISPTEGYREQGSLRNEDNHEPAVVLKRGILSGDQHSTNCTLTFSRSSIKLEGSYLSPERTPRSFDSAWPISDVKIKYSFLSEKKLLFQDGPARPAVILYLFLRSDEIDGKSSGIAGRAKFIISLDESEFEWLEKKKEIQSLDKRYKKTFVTAKFRDLEISYPEGDPNPAVIAMKDIKLLEPHGWLSGDIIDFYVKYLKQKISPNAVNKFYFFNNHFCTKLAGLNSNSPATFIGSEEYKRVRRWTKEVDLFEQDFIVIPVNSSNHWSLIIIHYPGLAVDPESEQNKSPCITHLDSKPGIHKGLEEIFQSYLWQVWNGTRNSTSKKKAVKSSFLKLPFNSPKLPEQPNDHDCGIFLLHYLELFMQEFEAFGPKDRNPSFLSENWFLPAEAVEKRAHIRRVISEQIVVSKRAYR